MEADANPTSVSNTYCPASLSEFVIFTPKNVPEGKEYEKLLYFYPESVEIQDQTKHVGLAEALINFTGKFSSTPCEALHFEKRTSVLYHPEPNFWFIMGVNNPSVTKVKEGKTTSEYKENELDETCLQTVLKQCYGMFKLFNGTCQSIQDQNSEQFLREKLKAFFSEYLFTIRFDQLDLFTTLQGIHFLPVDKNVYLRIQGFINTIENSFPKIKYSTFMYEDHLLWSGMEQDEMRELYRYCTQYLCRTSDPPQQSPHLSRAASSSSSSSSSGFMKFNKIEKGFITGPENVQDPKTKFSIPLVYIGDKNVVHELVIFKLQGIACLFLIEPSGTDTSFYKNLYPFISQQVSMLSDILAEQYQRKQGSEEQYRYIYFNHMNFALKTSVKDKGAVIPRETMKMLNDIHADFEKSPENINEVLIRTQNDRWVVGRKSEQREFYVIFDHKNSHLIEINEEVRKLSSTYFNNIFID